MYIIVCIFTFLNNRTVRLNLRFVFEFVFGHLEMKYSISIWLTTGHLLHRCYYFHPYQVSCVLNNVFSFAQPVNAGFLLLPVNAGFLLLLSADAMKILRHGIVLGWNRVQAAVFQFLSGDN